MTRVRVVIDLTVINEPDLYVAAFDKIDAHVVGSPHEWFVGSPARAVLPWFTEGITEIPGTELLGINAEVLPD